MNQQRSRRFRSAQEAKEKDEARKESIALWEGASPFMFPSEWRVDATTARLQPWAKRSVRR